MLPNGLRLVLREDHQAPLVAIDVWVRAGSGREEPSEVGAAHFLEHLLFKGTATRKPGEIDEAIEELGGTLMAGTQRDAAHFYTTLPSAHWQEALPVLADALQNPALRPEDVERERTVILDELAYRAIDPQRQALDALDAALFAGHPYDHPTAGEPGAIHATTRDRIAGFWQRLYAPSNTTVVLVGDIQPGDAQAAIERAFGAWARRDVPDPPRALTPPTAPSPPPDAPQGGLLAVGYRLGPASDARELCTADVVAQLVGDAAGGRVARALAGQHAGTADGPEHTVLRDAGVLAFYATASPGRVDEVRRALSNETEKLARERVPAAELAWARRRALGNWLYDAETYAGQARLLGSYDCAAAYTTAVRYADTVGKVTADDVLAFAGRYLKDAGRAETLVPAGGAK